MYRDMQVLSKLNGTVMYRDMQVLNIWNGTVMYRDMQVLNIWNANQSKLRKEQIPKHTSTILREALY